MPYSLQKRAIRIRRPETGRRTEVLAGRCWSRGVLGRQPMTALSRPLCLPLDGSLALDVSRFAEVFAHQSAAVTGRDATLLEHESIGAIWQRWWGKGTSVKAPDSAVVHWLLEDARRRTFFSSRFAATATALAALDPEARCLLDHFRRSDTPRYEWAILGACGTSIPTHADMFGTASWNLLLSGRKTWRFWPPGPLPIGGDPPTLSFEQWEAQLVWIPEEWWHAVDYSEASLCLSKNLVLQRSLARIAEAAAGHDSQLEPHLMALIAIGEAEDALLC